jgi:ABC-type transporter Mla MlaB component
VRRLEKTIAAATPGESFRVDLAHVSEFDDFGLAVLAHVLERCRATPVALQGLRHHQARVLRYFGVDATRLGVRSVDEA